MVGTTGGGIIGVGLADVVVLHLQKDKTVNIGLDFLLRLLT